MSNAQKQSLDDLSKDTTDRLNRIFAPIWAEMEVDRAKSNPKGLYFPKGAQYRYYSVKTGKKRTVKGIAFTPQIRFCRSVHPNHAGYYVAWVDNIMASGKVIRDGWTYNQSKKLIMEHTLHEYKKTQREHDPKTA
jgi:hypothetical protein